jgi:antitoxin MazE
LIPIADVDTVYIHRIDGGRLIKKLTKHGNSLALVIDRSVLSLLNIGADTPIEIKTDGKRLFLAPEGINPNPMEVEAPSRNGRKKPGRKLKSRRLYKRTRDAIH